VLPAAHDHARRARRGARDPRRRARRRGRVRRLSTIPDDLRRLATSPDRYTRISGDVTRTIDDRYCLIQGNTWAGVSDVRVAESEVERLVAEIRDRVPAQKTLVWWLNPETTPVDLPERLETLGFRIPDDRAGILYALACATQPPEAPAEVSVRRVESFDDHLASAEVMWEAFRTPKARRQAQRQHLRSEFEAAREAGVPVTFLAELDGRPAGVGRSIYSDLGVFLIAGAVAEWARGRGVYRALVRARWDDAAARGTPGLVTEAVPDTSYPILKRLGFVDVCTIRRLEDPR
jgi:hypothetical protein